MTLDGVFTDRFGDAQQPVRQLVFLAAKIFGVHEDFQQPQFPVKSSISAQSFAAECIAPSEPRSAASATVPVGLYLPDHHQNYDRHRCL